MNRSSCLGWVLILAIGLFTASAWSKESPAASLLVNSGFEDGDVLPGTMFPGWHLYSTDKTLLATTAEAQRSGQRCAKIAAQQKGSQFQGLTQGVEIDDAQKYTFSVFVRSCAKTPLKGTAYGQLVIEWLGADGAEIDRVWTDNWTQSLSRKQWKEFRIRKVRPPKGAVQAIVGVHLFEGKSGGKGAVYVDDVTVVMH